MLGARRSAPAPTPAPSRADPKRRLNASAIAALPRVIDGARLRLRRLADFERIDPDRLRDVLQLYSAEIAHFEIEPPFYLTIGVLDRRRASTTDRRTSAFPP